MTKKSKDTKVKDNPTNTTIDTIRDEQGRFLPGHPLWQLHAFKEGNIGRPNKWTPAECAEIITGYLQDRIDNDRTITKAGLMVALGISHEALSNYASGEYGKTEDDKRAYVDIFSATSAVIEDQLEEQLSRDKGQVSGVIFRLKNHYGWRDEKHLSVASQETKTIQVMLHPGPLYDQLIEAGADIQALPVKTNGELIEHDQED